MNSKKYPSNNGTEFTKHLLPKGGNTTTLLEEEPARLGIRHKLIRPYMPRHNGKAERSHSPKQVLFAFPNV